MYVSVIFLIITSTFGENLKPGTCPNVTVPITDIHKIVGVWYEYSRSCNVGNSFDKCQRLVIDDPVEGSSSSIFESKSLLSDVNTKMLTNFIMKNDKLHITYYLPTIGNMIRDFTILGVDHNNYCITWHCMEIGSMSRSFMFLVDIQIRH
ncbi:uncharacterized protein LOC103574610 [Microplitis demolitor]|uniref:uncharacterized protein LOC103574610 n=1 Tax=Microplitis demolitor TaxID=69319 RepID=UPI0004CCD1E6|nr:uncharacterized protein LOC103574610 [Microplitis demolitor]